MKCTRCEKNTEAAQVICLRCSRVIQDKCRAKGYVEGYEAYALEINAEALAELCKVVTGKRPDQLTAADEVRWPGITLAVHP